MDIKKKYFIDLIGILILILFIGSSSFGQTKNATIIGTWIIDSVDVKASSNIPTDPFKKESVIGQVYTFNSDSTFLKDNLPGGKYSITKEGDKVFLTFLMEHMGVTTKSEIVELTSKTLTYKMDYGTIVFTIHSIRKT